MTYRNPPYIAGCCGFEKHAGLQQHADDCEVLARRVNHVALCRSIVLAGVTQNPELMLTDFTTTGWEAAR